MGGKGYGHSGGYAGSSSRWGDDYDKGENTDWNKGYGKNDGKGYDTGYDTGYGFDYPNYYENVDYK